MTLTPEQTRWLTLTAEQRYEAQDMFALETEDGIDRLLEHIDQIEYAIRSGNVKDAGYSSIEVARVVLDQLEKRAR